jgi:putative transposase
LASEYGRYGYRRITVKLREAGWQVSEERVQRIWRREGLKVPQKQRPRGRLWLNDGSCVRLRAERANHVWSYDFVSAMTHDGRTQRLLVLIDEYTRECLAIRVARRLRSYEVIQMLADVMVWRGIPEHIRSDNGPEFVAKELRNWLGKDGEISYSLQEAQIVVEKWRVEYNTRRPHSALGYVNAAGLASPPPCKCCANPLLLFCQTSGVNPGTTASIGHGGPFRAAFPRSIRPFV